ncbi:MAG: hypothetical protein IT289_13495 [Oligoflexia bacterium]|nr:hypothetical protein [Oligoflexia bacterium]
MEVPVINLRLFAPKYRQALLYAMIEGLERGKAFCFSDDRDPEEIEKELSASDLGGYQWTKKEIIAENEVAYLIERMGEETEAEAGGCCGCCCGSAEQ